jgi:hypothetical protein
MNNSPTTTSEVTSGASVAPMHVTATAPPPGFPVMPPIAPGQSVEANVMYPAMFQYMQQCETIVLNNHEMSQIMFFFFTFAAMIKIFFKF